MSTSKRKEGNYLVKHVPLQRKVPHKEYKGQRWPLTRKCQFIAQIRVAGARTIVRYVILHHGKDFRLGHYMYPYAQAAPHTADRNDKMLLSHDWLKFFVTSETL